MHFLWSDAADPRPRRLAQVRRLVILVSVVVFADTVLFSAIIPLLPHIVDDLDLSKLQAGMLVGAYGAGAMIGGIPSGLLATRIGPKRAAVAGLLLLSLATIAFAFSSSGAALGATRFVQGLASAMTWAGALAWLTLSTPREQRGKTLGTVFGFAVLGFIVGPAIGALGELTSIRGVFVAIGVTAALVALAAASFPAGARDEVRPRALRRALGDTRFLAAVWVTLVPALFFGVLDVLVPLSLGAAGWGSVAIAAAFVAAGFTEVGLAPAIGSISDRRGRLYPIRLALLLLAIVAVVFAVSTVALLTAALVIGASIAASGIYSPGIALVSDRAEADGMAQTLAFGVMNTSWAIGAMAGPLVGGALGEAVGDPAPYLMCAALAVLTVPIARFGATGPVRSATS